MALLSWEEIKKRNLQSIVTCIAGLLFLCGFVFPKLQPLLMALCIVLLLVSRQEKDWKKMLDWKKPWVWMIVLYFSHLIGALYSANSSFTSFDLGFKVGLVFIPVLALGFTSKNKVVLQRFVVGAAVFSSTICLANALIQILFYQHNVLLMEDEFSLFLHRSYQGVFWLIGALIAFVPGVVPKPKMRFTILLVLVCAAFLTFSKAAIISGILIGMGSLLRVFRSNWKVGVMVIVGALLFAWMIDTITLKPRARMMQMIESVSNQESVGETNSNGARILMWQTALSITKNHCLVGVGTGDVKDEMRRVNEEKGYKDLAALNLNAHNQFLNFSVALGLLGLFPFVMIWFTTLRNNWKENRMALYVVITLIFFNLTESSFESEAGFIFQLLLLSLLNVKQVTNAQDLNRHPLSQ